MTESLAFTVFVTLLLGGLAAVTLGMVAVVVVLLRRDRNERRTEHVRHSSDRPHAMRH
jgi:hypothetical protein